MRPFGISAALLTPFSETGSVDLDMLADHARNILARGVARVTLFGTTGEGASVSMAERTAALDHMRAAGIPADAIIQTIYANAAGEAIAQAAEGLLRGVSDFLLVPPCYFKDCSDDGLFDWHGQVFADADPRARFILYHIPHITGVALSPRLVARLARDFPDRLLAVKDSSGNWNNAAELLNLDSVPVLVGDERLLHRAAALGGAGAISGLANLHPERLCRVFDTATEDPELSGMVTHIVSQPVIPLLKTLLAQETGLHDWARVRAPLRPLGSDLRDRAPFPNT